MNVYVLQHVRVIDDDDNEDVKLIGVFSTEAAAEAAISELRVKPGFAEYPDGFHVGKYELDHVWWSDGFVTIPREG